MEIDITNWSYIINNQKHFYFNQYILGYLINFGKVLQFGETSDRLLVNFRRFKGVLMIKIFHEFKKLFGNDFLKKIK